MAPVRRRRLPATASTSPRRRSGHGWATPNLPRSPLPPRSPAPSPALEPLRPRNEVEVRLDADGFFGTWYEATVVGSAPGRGGRSGTRYTVSYSHIEANNGGPLAEGFARTHIRPRPPPPGSSPPRFRVHDIVEAMDRGGWWSGIVVAAAADPSGGGSVRVAFPITREVIAFAPHLVRPRRDYVGGEWAPSRAVVAEQAQPKRVLRVYDVGHKVEVCNNREVYGDSWFAATVTRVVDRFSYIVEYSDQDDGENSTEYLYWGLIRPAMDHSPRESEFQLVPRAAVEAYCDGAWSPGVVHRLVGEDEYEVTINREDANQMVTKVVELLKPRYRWDGNRWSMVKPKANMRQQSASGKRPSPFARDSGCSGVKKTRNELQQQEPILESEPVSVSEMNNPSSASCETPATPPLSVGHSTPPNGTVKNVDDTVINQEIQPNMMLPENKVEERHHLQGNLRTNEASANPSNMQVSTRTNIAPLKYYIRKLKMSNELDEMKTTQSPVDVTTAGQKRGGAKAAECPLAENEAINQKTIPMVPPGFQLMHNKKGINSNSNLLDKELNSTVSSSSQANINAEVKSNTPIETPISKSSSIAGSSMPSHLPVSQISGQQVVFVKSSRVWSTIESFNMFKKAHKPHFTPLLEFPAKYREEMALGLIWTFATLAEDIKKSSLADSMDLFEEKSRTLCRLKENGFNVDFLQKYLTRLVQIKTSNIRHLEEKENLRAQITEKTSSLSRINLLLEENYKAISELEKSLCGHRDQGQKIAKEKEHEDAELSRLTDADMNVEEACGGDEQQFHSILAEMQRKNLALDDIC